MTHTMKDLHTFVSSQVNLAIIFNSHPVKASSPFVLACVAGVRKGRGIGGAVRIWGRGPGGPSPRPLMFRSNWGPKGRKKIFQNRPSPLQTYIRTCMFFISGSGWPPPSPLSEGLEPPMRHARNHLLLFFQTPATLSTSFMLPFIARQGVV